MGIFWLSRHCKAFLACIIAAIVPIAWAANAPDFDQKVNFAIQPQLLVSALIEFSRQAQIQVMSPGIDLKDRRAPGLSGSYSIRKALDLLLAGSGLSYRPTGPNTIAIALTTGANNWPAAAPPGAANNSSLPSGTHDVSPPTAGDAANMADRPIPLETIVVTAQKRQQALKEVPISVVAVTNEELSERNVQSIDDLVTVVPGLSISDAAGSRRVLLRGISNIFGGSSALIGMYLDEASVTSSSAAQLDLRTYDLDRVEVLRGPQGTLYGEGSVGGTIRFITKDPRLDRFEMNADVAALFTEDGAPSQRIESVVNVPLLDDQLALRAVGTFDHEGGWIDQPAANRQDINSQNVADVRVKGLWKPSADFAALAMAVIHRNDGTQNPGEDAQGNYTQAFNLTTTPSIQDDYDLYNLTLTYDFPVARLLSSTSDIRQDQQNRNVGGSAQYAPPPSLRSDFYSLTSETSARNINEELRLTSSTPGAWNWTVGGFYRHFRNSVDTPVAYYGMQAPPGTPLPASYSYGFTSLSESGSLFADTNYKFFDRLTLGVGARYFRDRQDYQSGGVEQNGRFHSLDPRVYLEYQLNDAVNAYGSAAKGFRSGGFNQLNQPKFGPENVWTYELGTKASVLEDRLNFDADIFLSNYNDYQITGVLPPPALPENIYRNAGNAQIKGVELDAMWRPIDQWTVSFAGDYLHAVFTKIDVTTAAYVVGDPVDFIPKYQFTISVRRDFNWQGKAGFARLDFSDQDRETYRNRQIGPWYYGQSDLISLLNFNSNLQWSQNLSLGIFVQNLLNERRNTYPAYIDGGGAVRSRPRTIGVRFGVQFR